MSGIKEIHTVEEQAPIAAGRRGVQGTAAQTAQRVGREFHVHPAPRATGPYI